MGTAARAVAQMLPPLVVVITPGMLAVALLAAERRRAVRGDAP